MLRTWDRRRARRRRALRCRAPASERRAPASAAALTSRSTTPRTSASSSSVRQLLRLEQLAHPHERIAPRFGLALRRRLVQLLVVRERVRVRPDDASRGRAPALARAHVRHRFAHRVDSWRGSRCRRSGYTRRPGKCFDDARDVAAGRLHFDRHRDRVAVVFDQIEHRQLARAGGVQRFPELALARRALADRDVGDFVGLKLRLAIRESRSTRS